MTTKAWSPALRRGVAARIAQVVIALAGQAAILFVGAGTTAWTWAWVFLGISLVTVLAIGTISLRASPETVAERARGLETRGWDRVVGGLCGAASFLALPLVAALDQRLRWTAAFPIGAHLAGAGAVAGGYALTGWSMLANTFFSTAVRIQSDRGHAVCRDGPYRFVRHPGYVGFSLQWLGTPLLLGSAWALAPGAAAVALLAIRTALEDRMLRAELPGYADYASQVRCRLIPGVW